MISHILFGIMLSALWVSLILYDISLPLKYFYIQFLVVFIVSHIKLTKIKNLQNKSLLKETKILKRYSLKEVLFSKVMNSKTKPLLQVLRELQVGEEVVDNR